MNIETFRSQVQNVFITSDTEQTSVDATQWANYEGVNILVTTHNLGIRAAMCLRWEELDMILAAVSVLRAPE